MLQRKKKRLFKKDLKPEYGPHDDKYLKQMELYRDQGVNISLTEKELEGKHRVAVDGLISQTQCERLMQLAGVRPTSDTSSYLIELEHTLSLL